MGKGFIHALNDLRVQSGGGGSGITYAVDGRLDLNSETELAWNPVSGPGLSLYDGSDWTYVVPSANPTLANTADDLDSVALAVDSVYDIFGYYVSATSFTIVAKKWTNATTRGYSLYEKDGILTHENSADGLKRRFLGIVYMYNDAATAKFKDEKSLRFLMNRYNKQRKALGVDNPYSASTNDSGISTVGWESWNTDGDDWLVKFVADGELVITLAARAHVRAKDAKGAFISIGLNGKAPSEQTEASFYNAAGSYADTDVMSYYAAVPAVGYNYAYPLQRSTDGDTSSMLYFWYEDGATRWSHAQFEGEIWC